MPAFPWITSAELIEHLGATIPEEEADRLTYAASSMVAAVVDLTDDEGEPLPAVPDAVLTVCLMVAAEVYKAGTGVDGSMSVDWTQQVPATVSSVIVRRYGALLSPWVAVEGLVG